MILLCLESFDLESDEQNKQKEVDTQLSLNFDDDISPVEGNDRVKEFTRSELEEEYETVVKEKEELLHKIEMLDNEKISFADDAKKLFDENKKLKSLYKEKCKELESIKNNNSAYLKLVGQYNELVSKYNKINSALNNVCRVIDIPKELLF